MSDVCCTDHKVFTEGCPFCKIVQLSAENTHLNKALSLKLDALPSGLSAGQSKVLESKLSKAHALLSHAVHKMHLRTEENREWLDKACDWLGEKHLDTV